MDFKILHLSSTRARVRVNFRLTPDVKVYFKEQASKIENIQKVDFYQDEYTFVVMFKDSPNSRMNIIELAVSRAPVANETKIAAESSVSMVTCLRPNNFNVSFKYPDAFHHVWIALSGSGTNNLDITRQKMASTIIE